MKLIDLIDSDGRVNEDEYFKALADYFCIDAETVRDISKDVAKENYLTELIDKIEIHVGGFGK